MLIIKLGISLNQRWYGWGSTAYIYISLRTTLTKGISIWLLISSSTPLVRPKSAIPPLLETTRVSDIIIWECPRPPNGGWGGGGVSCTSRNRPFLPHSCEQRHQLETTQAATSFIVCAHWIGMRESSISWTDRRSWSDGVFWKIAPYLFSIFFFGECVEYVLMFNAITM